MSAEPRHRADLRRETDELGPSGEVLRLQRLAGNSAVTALMRSEAVQREAPTEAVPADEKAKPKGITIVVDDPDIGSFVVESVQHSAGPRGGTRGPVEVVITRRMDDLSPKLFERSVNGEAFGTVTIMIPGLPLVMKNVMISSYQVGTGGGEPYETMTFIEAPEEEQKPSS